MPSRTRAASNPTLTPHSPGGMRPQVTYAQPHSRRLVFQGLTLFDEAGRVSFGLPAGAVIGLHAANPKDDCARRSRLEPARQGHVKSNP